MLHGADSRRMVDRPLTGARIETFGAATGESVIINRPLTGARIETLPVFEDNFPLLIAPSRGRGLKQTPTD